MDIHQHQHGRASYAWDFGDGTTSTETSPVHTFTGNGSYSVCLTVTGDCGNSQTCTPVVLTVGVEERDQVVRRASPDPADHTIRIELVDQTVVRRITAIDAQGRRMDRNFSGTVSSGVLVNVDDLASGSYVIELELSTGARVHLPVMISHQ